MVSVCIDEELIQIFLISFDSKLFELYICFVGLGVIYSINTVLAVLAAFKAGERGQPAPLWIAKTFTVGGLAYDQLTQLPTIEEMEKAKARKGKRALKNKTKSKY